jgi:hypothetical protein
LLPAAALQQDQRIDVGVADCAGTPDEPAFFQLPE